MYIVGNVLFCHTLKNNGPVIQRIECQISNLEVAGLNPAGITKLNIMMFVIICVLILIANISNSRHHNQLQKTVIERDKRSIWQLKDIIKADNYKRLFAASIATIFLTIMFLIFYK